MSKVIVSYKVKPGQADDNQQYVKKVFEELERDKPAGVRYATFLESDGATFVHIASIETANGDNPLSHLQAFQAFQAGLKERCEVQPVVIEMEEVGSYQVFGR